MIMRHIRSDSTGREPVCGAPNSGGKAAQVSQEKVNLSCTRAQSRYDLMVRRRTSARPRPGTARLARRPAQAERRVCPSTRRHARPNCGLRQKGNGRRSCRPRLPRPAGRDPGAVDRSTAGSGRRSTPGCPPTTRRAAPRAQYVVCATLHAPRATTSAVNPAGWRQPERQGPEVWSASPHLPRSLRTTPGNVCSGNTTACPTSPRSTRSVSSHSRSRATSQAWHSAL